MADKKYQKKKVQEMDDSGFGEYDTGRGGGGPVGGKFGYGNGRGIWDDNGRPTNRKDGQPRTDDGKFTYNSVNGKKLAPTSDPNRGKTVNPLLTSGVNGIKIKDVEKQFEQESGSYWDKYKDKWYKKGGEIVTTDMKTRVAGKAIWQVARGSYDEVKGEFKDESSTFDTVKVGRKSKEEIAAGQKVQQTGEEQAVMDNTSGGIKTKSGSVQTPTNITKSTPQQSKWKKMQPSAPAQSPIAPQPGTTDTGSSNAVLDTMFGGEAPAEVKEEANNEPAELQDFSGDANLAKTNPAQFANKYQNEINTMLDIIHKSKPNFPAKTLISLIGSGKLNSIDQVKKLFPNG